MGESFLWTPAVPATVPVSEAVPVPGDSWQPGGPRAMQSVSPLAQADTDVFDDFEDAARWPVERVARDDALLPGRKIGVSCNVCGSRPAKLCVGCCRVYYCSRPCQTADWKAGHARLCGRKPCAPRAACRAAFLRSKQYELVSSALPRNAQRARVVQSLINATGVLDTAFDVHEVVPASARKMQAFHSRDFVDVLQKSRCVGQEELAAHGLVDDCATFGGVFELASLEAGGSVQAAQLLCSGMYDTAVWWGGGRHHAKTDLAAGYCYVNDVVLAILELLKSFERVMYIDIDVHHGDGVEEAFCYSHQVLTCSFHHFAPLFFPGTGALSENHGACARSGKQCCLNVPLHSGCGDETFLRVFDHAVKQAAVSFVPTVVVLQCGADALAGDPLGEFNLTTRGYIECLKKTRQALPSAPVLLLGGGGYNQLNTARCWASLTFAAVGQSPPKDIPEHEFCEQYSPDYSFDVRASHRRDCNSEDSLLHLLATIDLALSSVACAQTMQQEQDERNAKTELQQEAGTPRLEVTPRSTAAEAREEAGGASAALMTSCAYGIPPDGTLCAMHESPGSPEEGRRACGQKSKRLCSPSRPPTSPEPTADVARTEC